MADYINRTRTITEPQYLPTAPAKIGEPEQERKAPTNPMTAELRKTAEQVRTGKQWLADQVNFGYELNDKDYALMTSILENSMDWEADMSRFEQALMYSRHENISFSAAFENIDALNEAFMGRKPEYTKTATKAVRDSLEIGILGRMRGEVGLKLMQAEEAESNPKYRNYVAAGDPSRIEEYRAQMAAIDSEIERLQDSTPRSLITKLFKVTAQSVPYTLDIMAKSAAVGMGGFALAGAALSPVAAGTLGKSVAAGVASANAPGAAAATKLMGSALFAGANATETATALALADAAYSKAATVAAWKRSADLSRGAVYYDLRQKGVEKNVALHTANINGAIQGAIETCLGVIPALGKAAKTAIGLQAGASLSAKVFAGLYARGTIGGIAAGAMNILNTAAGEGLEEFLQSIADNVSEYTALTISKETNYTFDKSSTDVLKEALIEGIAGFGSALLMGGLPGMMNAANDVQYARNLKKDAQNIPSKEYFVKFHKDDEQFGDMPAAQRKDTLGDIYDKNHTIEGVSNAEAANLDTDYLAINESADEEESEAQATDTPQEPIKRRKDHRLHTQESTTVTENADGSESHTLKLGSADSRRRYGRIEFIVKGDTVTIDNVYLKAGQEALTGEFVTELMRRYEGYNIEWQPTTESQIKVRDQLIKDNKENPGQLQMFKGRSMDEVLEAAGYLKEKLPNLNRHEATVAAGLMRVIAEGRGRTLQQFIHDDIQFKTFAEAVANDVMSEQEAALNKGAYQLIENGTKAIIYVGKEGDFSTLFHEVVHFISQTSPQSKDLATALKGAADTDQFRQYLEQHKRIMDSTGLKTADDIINAIKEMSDNPMEWNRAQNEIVAVLGETYAQEGRTFNSELKGLFDKIIDFFMKIYRMMKQNALLNDDIVKAYDALLAGNPELKAQMEQSERNETAQDNGQVLHQGKPSAEEMAEADRQYNEVVAKYKGTDQWLKAPNGQPTKLTERQWVQVRTPNFIAWFGDWMNDPENASKVVDENGEPKVVYHGSRAEFDIFDITKSGHSDELAKVGFFFAETSNFAQNFAQSIWYGEGENPVIYDVYLNVRNPYIYQTNKVSDAEHEKVKNTFKDIKENEDALDRKFEVITDVMGRPFTYSGVGRLWLTVQSYVATDNNTTRAEQTIRDYAESYEEIKKIEQSLIDSSKEFLKLNEEKKQAKQRSIEITYTDAYEQFKTDVYKQAGMTAEDANIGGLGRVLDNPEEAIAKYKKEIESAGYDGLIIKDTEYDTVYGGGSQYVVFSPEQIKSATDNVGTFSQSNPSILFQTAVDLTQDFADISNGKLTEQDIETHINSLIGQVIDTATEPLQIQITQDNKAHVITTNVKLKGNQKRRHNVALNKIEKIINNAREVNTSPTDMTHNTSPKTLEHKQNVVEYVYFDSPIRIGTDLYNVELATERMKGQDPDVLDLYNVHVKKTPAAAHLSTLQTEGFNYNNTTSDENVNPHSNLLFQSAYHGSGASFDKFDTDFMGTGEGAQAFGWGIYLTQSEGIARNYADQTRYEGEGVYYAIIGNTKSAISYDMSRGKSFEELKSAKLKQLELNIIEGWNAEANKQAYETIKNWTEDDVKVHNLYTVTIPDDTGSNYLHFDKKVGVRLVNRIAKALDEKGVEFSMWQPEHIKSLPTAGRLLYAVNKQSDFPGMPGRNLYDILSIQLGSPEAASEFLSSLGYVGIDYPANSMSGGNRYGKRNFVIFNADDITIDNHLLWQSKSREEIEDSLIADAKGQTLDEWLDFNRFLGDSNLDEAALTAIWEKANHVTEVEGEKVVEAALLSEEEKDTAFRAMIDTDDGVRKFIQDLRSVDAYIRDIEREGMSDEEDMDFLNRLADASKRIETEAAPFIKNLLKNNNELSEESIKKVRGMVERNLAAYRDLYAAASGNENLTSNIEALPFIDEPTRERMQTMSIAEKRRLVDNLEAQELKKKILKGEELYEGEAEKVVKMLDAEILKLEGEKEALKASLDNKQDWLDIKEKKLLNAAEEAKATEKAINKLERNIRSRLDKGMRISKEDYQKLAGWKDKLELLQDDVNALNKQTKLKAILQEREKYRQKQAELKQKQKERQFAKKVHDYKVKLASYIMKKPSKTVNWEQAEQILALQAVFGRTSGYDNFFINMNGKRMNLTAFRSMVEREAKAETKANEGKTFAALTPYQWKRYFNKSLAEYTVQDLETLADTVRYLTEQGRHEWQAKVDQRAFEASQWQNLLINEIAGNPRYTDAGDEPLPETGESEKKKRTFAQLVRTGWYKTLNMARKAQILDGNRKATAYRLLVEEKRAVQEKEYEAIRNRMKPVTELMEKLGVKAEDFYEMHTLKIGKNEQHYTTSQLIYGIKAQLEQRNMEAFVYGNLISQREKEFYGHNDNSLRLIGEARLDDFIKQAQTILAGKENVMKVAEAIWNDWQDKDNFARLNRAAIDEYNMPVDPVAFYMPISRKDFNGTELAAKIADDLYNTNAGKGMTAVKKGMINARLTISPDHQMPVDMNYFTLWKDSVMDQEHFIASNAYVRKLNRVFKALGSKDLRANIVAVYGQGMMNDIDNYINEVANPNINTDTQGVNKFLTFLRGALYPAYLAFKSSSVILQMITSPAPFLREVGPVELAKGLIQMSLHPVETWRYVTELSAMMENRSMNPLIDEIEKAAERYTDPKYKRLLHKIQETGTIGLEMADRWAVTAGWLAVFDKKKAEYEAQGMEAKQAEREAVKYADDVVYETQPTGDKTELAPLFKVRGPAWQAFTQFQVSLNVIWNNLTYDVANSDFRNHEVRKAMGTLIGYALAGIILYSVQEGFDDDDDAEDIILKLLYGATTQYTSSIPLVSSNIDNIIRNKMTGDAWYSRSSQLYPGFDALAQGVATGNVDKLARAVGIFYGAPVSGWKEFEHSFYNRKKGEWRFYPKAFLGRREK